MHYSRGQDTFFSKVLWVVNSLCRLSLLTFLLALVLFLIQFWFYTPQRFFLSQKKIITYFKLSGFGSLERIYELTLQNIVHHKDTFFSFFMNSGLISLVFLVFAMIFFYKRGQGLKGEKVKRGVILITPSLFNKKYQAVIDQEISQIRKDLPSNQQRKIDRSSFMGQTFSFSQGGLQIPEYALYRHLAVLGTTGVGKSTVIKWYLDYCRKNGEKVIIPDVNGEYASEFYRPGDTILSLYDKRTKAWSFEKENGVNPSEFAKFLIPSQDEKNAFWWKGARQVLAYILEKYQTAEKIWQFISSGDEDFVSNLDGIARKIAGKEGSPQAAGITGSSLLDLGFLQSLNYWPKMQGRSDFYSVLDWAQNEEKSWIFLTFSDSDKEATMPLLKLWLNIAILGLLKRQLGDKAHIPLNIIIDELTSLGKIELLPLALERSRKYKGKVVLGYQSEHQLLSLYGREVGASIKANTGTKVIFRVTEPHEAKELSDFLGKQEILKKQVGESYDALKHRDSFSEHETIKNAVLDSEIQNLHDGEFFIKSLNVDPCKDFTKKWVSTFVEEPHQYFHGYPPNLESKKNKNDATQNNNYELEIHYQDKS